MSCCLVCFCSPLAMTHVLSCIARWISKRNDGADIRNGLNEGPTQTSGVLAYRDIRMIELDGDSGRLTVIGAVCRFSLHCRRRSRWPRPRRLGSRRHADPDASTVGFGPTSPRNAPAVKAMRKPLRR